MPDFAFLQYVANPFSLIAVVAGVLGLSFRIMIKKFDHPNPGYTLAMYGMFIMAILALALGGLAIIFLLSSDGPTDEITSYQASRQVSFELIPTAHAQAENSDQTGWLWAGTTERVMKELAKAKIDSQTLYLPFIPAFEEKIVITKEKAYLRDAPPKYQWFFFRYKLGDLIETLPKGKKLKILTQKKVARQLWIEVEVLPEPEIAEERIPEELEKIAKMESEMRSPGSTHELENAEESTRNE